MRVGPVRLSALPQDARHRYRVRGRDTTGETTMTLYGAGGHVAPGASVYGGGVSLGERRWRVQLQGRDSGYNASLLWLMGATGTVASLLLALLLWSAATMRRRAVTLGRQLAERYRESEERFRTLNDLLPALVLMARADDGRIVYANEAAAARLGRGVADGARSEE